jgi:flagellar basal-body rod modification protein FlgD
MITQIQNQDPFKPMENGDFLAQLAQFGTVSGIQDLQKSFSTLSSSLISNQALQASSLVGRNIDVPSDTFSKIGTNSMSGTVGVHTSASSVTVDILDSSGQVVKTMNLGPQSKGDVKFTWDGTDNQGNQVLNGKYTIKAKARIGDQNVALSTNVTEKVASVTIGTGEQGLLLNTETNRTFQFNQVKKVQ